MPRKLGTVHTADLRHAPVPFAFARHAWSSGSV
jgi:hypothetical protein